MKTTLNEIRKHNPCANGWGKLLRTLNKTRPDDEPLSLITILDSNGLGDALWCLRAVEGHDKEMRLYAVWCARQVQHLIHDERCIDALDVAERYAHGNATQQELNAARDAASAAASAAEWAAEWDAAGDAARDAASAAASTAASAAAWDAAGVAEWDAAGDEQETKFREMFGEQP